MCIVFLKIYSSFNFIVCTMDLMDSLWCSILRAFSSSAVYLIDLSSASSLPLFSAIVTFACVICLLRPMAILNYLPDFFFSALTVHCALACTVRDRMRFWSFGLVMRDHSSKFLLLLFSFFIVCSGLFDVVLHDCLGCSLGSMVLYSRPVPFSCGFICFTMVSRLSDLLKCV